jgi:hypothetical protein
MNMFIYGKLTSTESILKINNKRIQEAEVRRIMV